ncbi:Dbl homology domain-containing protein [Pelagophyceae sp. CCMP2097]|nr:Dbl homology domain-containing protein [Pelagophyceae sp. CCMP2097]
MGLRDEGARRASEEVYSTEKSLFDDLTTLRAVFVRPLRDWAAALASGVAKADDALDGDALLLLLDRLFKPLDAILDVSSTTLAAFEQAQHTATFAQCFEQHEVHIVAAYGSYVGVFMSTWSELVALRGKSVSLDAFAKCCELQPANARRLTWASLVIIPVQRAPRYVLLICELKKRLEKADLPTADAARAEVVVRRAALAIDGEIKVEEVRRLKLSRVAAVFQRCDATLAWVGPAFSGSAICDAPFSRITKRGPVDAYFVLFDLALCYGDVAHSVDKMKQYANRMSAARRTSFANTLAESTDARKSVDFGNSPVENDSTESAAGRYSVHRELALEECYVALGGTAGIASANGGGGLAAWEFLVLSREKSFVVAARDAATARDWVERIDAAALARAAALGAKRDAPKSAAAYVARGGKVTTDDFEIVSAAGSAPGAAGGLRAVQARSGGSGVAMPLSSPTNIVHHSHDSSRRAAGSPKPARPVPAAAAAADNSSIVFSATVPIDLEHGLGLELQNDVVNHIVRVHSLATRRRGRARRRFSLRRR